MAEAEKKGIPKRVWEGLKNSFIRMAVALLGQPVKIITLDKHDDDLGKTDLYKNIYLNPWHELVADLPEKEAVMMIMGVYGHEFMHQALTDFSVFDRETKKKAEDERETFHMICNIIEDPTIEYFAHQFMGGKLLKALRFCIMQLYRQAKPLEESKSPADQFFNALIQYGDGGILKGSFTFPEARRVFHEVIPFVDNAIETFDCEQRVRYMDKVFELSRPIWEPEKDFMKMLHELWKRLGRDHGSSSGFGDPSIKDKMNKNATESKTQRRRKITFRKVSKEEAEEIANNAGSGPIDPDADIEVLIADEPLDASNGADGASIPVPPSGGKPGEGDEEGESGGISDGADNTEKSGSHGGSGTQKGDFTESNTPGQADGGDEINGAVEDEITEEEYHLSDDMLDEIANDIAKAIYEAKRQTVENTNDEIIDVVPTSKVYNGVKCTNYKVDTNTEKALAVYQPVVADMESMIATVVGQFKRIFKNDVGEKEYRNNGKISIKRLSSGKCTTRVFERRKAPSNKSDMAVIMLVDESGSMDDDDKYKTARKTAILLAEVFDRLHIPIKVIGFTESCRTVTHYHYLSWKNTPQERCKLLNISARMANFDGYSIRYGSELLNKRPEKHKLMIVVSDGCPAASYYASNDGIEDTRNAVHYASKTAKVLGILVGSSSPQKHQYMYGVNFLHITNVEALPALLAQRVKRIVKRW